MNNLAILYCASGPSTELDLSLEKIRNCVVGDYHVYIKLLPSEEAQDFKKKIEAEKVTVIIENDVGVYDGWNQLLCICKGTHVVFLGEGDWVHLNTDNLTNHLNYLTSVMYDQRGIHNVINRKVKTPLRRFGTLHGAIIFPLSCFEAATENLRYDIKYKIAADVDLICALVKSYNFKWCAISGYHYVKIGGVSAVNQAQGLEEVVQIYERYYGFKLLWQIWKKILLK